VPRGLREGFTASRAIGYDQALARLDGRMTQEEAIEATATATRRLVRRQESWFGSDPRVHWLDAAESDVLDRALALAEEALRESAAWMAGRVHDNGSHD
jgi:tRNA dimethylallyltransferase